MQDGFCSISEKKNLTFPHQIWYIEAPEQGKDQVRSGDLDLIFNVRKVIRSHMNMGTYMSFDWFEAAATAALGSKICTEIFVL